LLSLISPLIAHYLQYRLAEQLFIKLLYVIEIIASKQRQRLIAMAVYNRFHLRVSIGVSAEINRLFVTDRERRACGSGFFRRLMRQSLSLLHLIPGVLSAATGLFPTFSRSVSFPQFSSCFVGFH